MKKTLRLMGSVLMACLACSFFKSPQREQEQRYQTIINEEIRTLKNETQWNIRLLEPKDIGSKDKQKLSFDFQPRPGFPNQYVIRIDFSNDKQCPHFFPYSYLTFSLPNGQVIGTKSLPELNQRNSCFSREGVFTEECFYVLPAEELRTILAADSFRVIVEGRHYSIQADFVKRSRG